MADVDYQPMGNQIEHTFFSLEINFFLLNT